MKRSWTAAIEKLEREPYCRFCCLSNVPLDPAHILPRSRIKPGPGEDERNIVGLCRRCHIAYDQGKLDLLPMLTLEEQAYAAGLVGIEEARRRITGERQAA